MYHSLADYLILKAVVAADDNTYKMMSVLVIVMMLLLIMKTIVTMNMMMTPLVLYILMMAILLLLLLLLMLPMMIIVLNMTGNTNINRKLQLCQPTLIQAFYLWENTCSTNDYFFQSRILKLFSTTTYQHGDSFQALMVYNCLIVMHLQVYDTNR